MKIGKGTGKGCELCARNRTPGGGSSRGQSESMGHIQSAYCAGQVEVVTAAHNRCNRLIQAEIRRLVKEIELVTVDQELPMQKIWEHALVKDVCSWSELADAAWEEWQRNTKQRGSKKRTSQERMTLEEPLGMRDTSGNSDMEEDQMESEQDREVEAEICAQCANPCSRGSRGVEDPMICCRCRERDDGNWSERATCKDCWQKKLGLRRFDGMAVDQAQKRILTFEFKRTSDRVHTYAQDCHKRATEQYADLVYAARKVLRPKGWNIEAVNFIAGTKSVNVALWNQAMRTVGVPEAKWAEVRGKLMRLLLDEHDTILASSSVNSPSHRRLSS